MNGNNLLLDTNIILYLLAGDKTLVSLLDNKKIYLSVITELELLSYRGISEHESQIVRQFINDCIVVDINSGVKESCIAIRQKHQLKLPDAIIAATSLFLNMPLVSADKDFARLTDIEVVIYEK
jgi:predicted nucleic acid-binding protein